MVRRYEVTDEQWKIIEPHLENKAKRTERPQVDNRKGIIFRMTFWYPAVINLILNELPIQQVFIVVTTLLIHPDLICNLAICVSLLLHCYYARQQSLYMCVLSGHETTLLL